MKDDYDSMGEFLEYLCLDPSEPIEVEQKLFKVLYHAAVLDTQQYKHLFPQSRVEDIPPVIERAFDTDWENHSVYVNPPVSHRHAGRNCGANFKTGEPIYRCLDCGFDATCVLCVHCFNKDDHIGHRIVSSICSPRNMGICDCGDPEAWVNKIHCKSELQKSDEQDDDYKLDEHLSVRLKDIYRNLLNYVVKIFTFQTQTLPAVRDFISGLSTDKVSEYLKNDYEAGTMGTAVLYHDSHCLYFWNDEFHNFDQARNAIKTASGVSQERAVIFANQIDKIGRCELKSSDNIHDLVAGLKDSVRTGFTASITSKTDTLKQGLATILFKWISNTVNHPNHQFQKIARDAFCETLCSDYDPDVYSQPIFDLLSDFYDFDTKSGLLYQGYLPSSNCSSGKKIAKQKGSLFQYLLYFDIRFWKGLRKQIQTLIIPTLVSDLNYKRIGSKQIIDIYPLLNNNVAFLDREPHLNIMSEITTQFFSCPKNSTDIVTLALPSILNPMLEVLLSFVVTNDNGDSVFRLPKKENDRSLSKTKAVNRILHDLYSIFSKSTTLSPFFEDIENFQKLSGIIQVFNGCSTTKRKTGSHVESESYEYVAYMNIWYQTLQVINAFTTISKYPNLDPELLFEGIRGLLSSFPEFTSIKKKSLKDYEIVDYTVSEGWGSVVNPSSSLLASLLSLYCTSADSLKRVAGEGFDFLAYTDYSLRSIVMVTQIDCQFWVRNGEVVSTYSAVYKGKMFFKESPNMHDIFLIQVSLLTSDPTRSILNIIDRFELSNWYTNKCDLDSTVYEDKIQNMIEKFISFLYNLLTYREGFMNLKSVDEISKRNYKNFLIYNLFSGPKKYSELEYISEDDETFDNSLFEKVLNDISDFNAPRGLTDEGNYSLKFEFFKEVDPLNSLAQVLDFNKSVTLLSKAIASTTTNKTSWEDVIIPPLMTELENYPELGDFTRTAEFAKLLTKLLDYIVNNGKESHAPVLLHLIHAIILDDEQINGENHIIESFNKVPICEHLFSITLNTKFSKPVRAKADFILSKLIVKDSENLLESLAACFGTEEVEKYKELKKNVGVYFDETEDEKKRRLAKERQRKIMERMKKKQKAFLDKNEPTEDVESKGATEDSETDSNICVLCQRPGDVKDFLCAPLSVPSNNIFRTISSEDVDEFYFKRAFLNWGDDSVENPLKDAEGFVQDIKVYEKHIQRVGSSCNHLVHFKCLKDYLDGSHSNMKNVSCPLCKTQHDTYIPVIGAFDNIDEKIIEKTPNELRSTLYYDALLKGSSPSIMDYREISDINFKHFDANEHDAKLTILIGTVLANSIKQAEISTRINGKEAYYNFLNQIPEQTFKTFRLLLQYFIFLEGAVIGGTSKQALESAKENDGFINCFLLDYFLGKKGFHKTATKWVIFFTKTYMNMFLSFYRENHTSTVDDEQSEEISLEELELCQSAFCKIFDKDPSDKKGIIKEYIGDQKLFTAALSRVKKLLLPELRNLAILYKVLNSDFELDLPKDGENISIDEMLKAVDLPSFIELAKDASFSEHVENSRFSLPYPGVIKLVDLPLELSYFTTSEPSKVADDSFEKERFKSFELRKGELSNRIDYAVCLTCGTKFLSHGTTDISSHSSYSNCARNGGGIYLYPSENQLKIITKRNNNVYSKKINAPYLNSHGQSGLKAIQGGHDAKLNMDRYKHLNKLWLTGGIYSFLSRHAVPSRPNRNDMFDIIGTMIGQTTGGGQNTALNREAITNMIQNQLNISLMDLENDEEDDSEDEDDNFDEFNQSWEDEDDYDFNEESESEGEGMNHPQHFLRHNLEVARVLGVDSDEQGLTNLIARGYFGEISDDFYSDENQFYDDDDDVDHDDDDDDDDFSESNFHYEARPDYSGDEHDEAGDFDPDDFAGMNEDEIYDVMNTVSDDHGSHSSSDGGYNEFDLNVD